MPTYEYACRECDERLEAQQSFSDPALTVCPACGGPLRKVFGSIGIAFKGSGFYKTDSRTSAGKGKAKVDGASSSPSTAAASSSSSSSEGSSSASPAPSSSSTGNSSSGNSSSGSSSSTSSTTSSAAAS